MRSLVPAAALFLALAWPSRAVKSSGKSNGKSFRRSGAWVLSKEYMAQARCNQSGIPAIECAYKLDERLATCLAQLFRGRSVTELGAGVGDQEGAQKLLGHELGEQLGIAAEDKPQCAGTDWS